MASVYHAGEEAIQARVGVQHSARRVGLSIRSTIPSVAQDFLREQRMAVAGSIDARGRVWASLLTGIPGFMQAIDERTVRVVTSPAPGDPLGENLRARREIGMIAIDFASRRRMRLNGRAEMQPDGSFYVHAAQAYANCPKYIQAREYVTHGDEISSAHTISRVGRLNRKQRDWIGRADTFFIASFHQEGGADASHRGGNPGFVKVTGERRLVFPDYAGNHQFNTLGNILLNPRSGLLFMDFESGSVLQLTGEARVIWDTERAARIAGAERLVEFQIDEVIEIGGASPWRWRFIEYSPFNPV